MNDIDWQRSSFCSNGVCVEVARGVSQVLVRDSKHGDLSPRLAFTPGAWSAFVAGLRGDEFVPEVTG